MIIPQPSAVRQYERFHNLQVDGLSNDDCSRNDRWPDEYVFRTRRHNTIFVSKAFPALYRW